MAYNARKDEKFRTVAYDLYLMQRNIRNMLQESTVTMQFEDKMLQFYLNLCSTAGMGVVGAGVPSCF